MDIISAYNNSNNTNGCLKIQQLEDTAVNDSKTMENTFPWLCKFNKIIQSSVGSRNHQLLERSLLLYTQNILSSIGTSNVKISDAINLKNHINNMLIFFHLYWLDIKQDLADHNTYLNKMSRLLNLYINMELKCSIGKKASNHIKDSSKIAAKLFAALYIYLNNSDEHIFRVLLRIKYATEKYIKICDHIFTKSFTNVATKTTSITDVAYVRYLLAFKMWKKMDEASEKREKINKLAFMLLGQHMPKLRQELLEFVPKPPIGQENETLWLLQPNLFDLKQAHKCFLLFEDKLDNSGSLQCTNTIYTEPSNSMFQKYQMNTLHHQRDSIHRKANKDHLNSSQNHMALSLHGNKFAVQAHLLKKGTKNLKSLKKIKKKTKKTIVIDLTGDDEISVPYKVKRKTKKQNLEQSRSVTKKHKLQKHISTSEYLSWTERMDAITQDVSNKSFNKPISKNKITDNTENCTSISNRSSQSDAYNINLQKNEQLSATKNQANNVHPEFVKENGINHDYSLHCLKHPKFMEQNIEEFKIMGHILKENKSDNNISSHATYVAGNGGNSYSNPILQGKELLDSQEESAMETIPLFKMCQNNIVDQHSLKQELPTSTNRNTMQKVHKCCETVPIDVHDSNRLIIKKLKSIHDHSSQITEIIKQKVCHQVNECTNCWMKIDCKPLVFTNNDVTAPKTQDTLHNTFSDNENDVKSACDTNIIYMLSDCDKCVYVVNHIGERAMTVHVEKRMQCLDKSSDMCTVSTTFPGDQILESPLYNQHVSFDNMKSNDYSNDSKYSEITINDQHWKKKLRRYFNVNDRIHFSDPYSFDINCFDFDSKEENYESEPVNFPKPEEINEIMKTDSIDETENISFLHNIQNETLEDFFLSKINYDHSSDVSTKKDLEDNIFSVGISNDTAEFLPQKQSPFELDSTTDIFLNDKGIRPNNQIDVVDSSIDPVAFGLNTDYTFVRLPARSNKSMYQGSMEFRYT